jgi:predicted 3-demethylubiquinone-9 3-methyltransferase (glyoxalase superfamily)
VKNISTCLWFDDKAEDAFALYSAAFKNVKKLRSTKTSAASAAMSGRPAGSLMTLEFEIEGQVFVALNGGPMFKINPSVSFFVSCKTEEEIDHLYKHLSEGGSVLMPLTKYPFSEKYGWVMDKFGVSWQLNLAQRTQKIAPALMYVGQQNGRAEEAMKYYVSIFENSKILDVHRYEEGEHNTVGHVKHAKFSLNGQEFVAFDSSLTHPFSFNEGVSFVVHCKTQDEVDFFWDKLSESGEPVQCGWLKDKFGVSWQIVPEVLLELLQDADAERCARVTSAMMQMQKLDIAALQAAHSLLEEKPAVV